VKLLGTGPAEACSTRLESGCAAAVPLQRARPPSSHGRACASPRLPTNGAIEARWIPTPPTAAGKRRAPRRNQAPHRQSARERAVYCCVGQCESPARASAEPLPPARPAGRIDCCRPPPLRRAGAAASAPPAAAAAAPAPAPPSSAIEARWIPTPPTAAGKRRAPRVNKQSAAPAPSACPTPGLYVSCEALAATSAAYSAWARCCGERNS
jgi:hypothetical protein